MSDPTYNEEVRQYILDRYEELGHAARHIRALYDARTHGKFTRHHTTTVAETIAAHLNVHFSGDADLPDLSTWGRLQHPPACVPEWWWGWLNLLGEPEWRCDYGCDPGQ